MFSCLLHVILNLRSGGGSGVGVPGSARQPLDPLHHGLPLLLEHLQHGLRLVSTTTENISNWVYKYFVTPRCAAGGAQCGPGGDTGPESARGSRCWDARDPGYCDSVPGSCLHIAQVSNMPPGARYLVRVVCAVRRGGDVRVLGEVRRGPRAPRVRVRRGLDGEWDPVLRL